MKTSPSPQPPAFSFRELLIVVAIISLLAAAAMPHLARAAADQQGYPSTLGALTNLPPIVNTATASNQTSILYLRQGRGLALAWKFNSSAGNSNAVLWIYPSVDGTNRATVNPWLLQAPANGTTDVVVPTNWSRAMLEGYTALFFATITNAHASGILTNKGVTWNFPNT